MSTSERRWGEAGSSGPCEAWTADTESSTVTRCGRPPVRSFSLRPSAGRISASRPWTTWERLSLVETWTVSSAPRIASSVTVGVGDRGDEVAAHREEDACLPVAQRLDRVHRVVAVGPRRVDPELLLQRVEEVVGHPLPDAHRAVTLDVGVAADRAQPGAGLADVALEEREVGDLLDGGDRVPVLGDAHRPAEDRRGGAAQHLGRLPDLLAVEAGGPVDGVPVEVADVGRPLLEAVGVALDEVAVDRVPLQEVEGRAPAAARGRR